MRGIESARLRIVVFALRRSRSAAVALVCALSALRAQFVDPHAIGDRVELAQRLHAIRRRPAALPRAQAGLLREFFRVEPIAGDSPCE
jgi:hypothetical protein